MKNVKFSIIVPVYNIELYIDACINSIKNQTYNDWELILVNDGSSDKSAEICQKYSKEDSRITLINQENQGVSQARNVGIHNSTGDYITFIDGDDSWNADILSVMSEKIQMNSETDIWFATEYEIHYPSGEYKIIERSCKSPYNIDAVISNEVATRYILDSKWSVWLAFVKRELIVSKEIYFIPSAKLGEDADWMFRVCLESTLAGFIKERYYRYNVNREGSAMTTKSQAVCMSYLEVVKSWIDLYQEKQTQLIYMITSKLANNCAVYIEYVYDFDTQSKEIWRSFIVENRMYEYLDNKKRNIWKCFKYRGCFYIYIWAKAMRRKVPETCRKIIRKVMKSR